MLSLILPLTLQLHLQDMKRRIYMKEVMEKAAKHLTKKLDDHVLLSCLEDYKDYFMNIYDFKYEEGLHTPNEKFKTLFDIYEIKPIHFIRQSCYCIGYPIFDPITIHFSEKWSIADLLKTLNYEVVYESDCDNHRFYEGCEIKDCGDHYVVEIVFGS